MKEVKYYIIKIKIKNKEKALKILQSKIYQNEKERQENELGKIRSSQIGTMERCERIRTYNQNQDRVTDHRIGFTVYGYDKVFMGIGLDPIIDKLQEISQNEQLTKFLKSLGE